MRICLLAYRGNPYSGGQGVYLYQLARALSRRGHHVEAIVGPPYPQHLERWAAVHVLDSLHLWGRYREEWLPVRNPLQLLRPWNLLDFALTRLRFFPEPLTFSLRALALLARLQGRRRFDLVHDVQTLGLGVAALRAFGLPVVTTVHHPLTIDRRAAFDRDRTFEECYHTAVFYPVTMQGWVIRRLERVITASLAGREAIERDFGVAPGRMAVVPNGVETDFFRNPGGLQRRPATLLFVGNTDDVKKGARYLVQALQALPAEVRLRVVDEPYPLKKLLFEEVQRLGLEARVSFLGKLPPQQLREEYCRAAMLVQPSLYEGFGLPAAEALCCGTPVVATAVGAVPEVLAPEAGQEVAVLVASADASALATAIAGLLADLPRRQAMGRAGAARMRRLYSWDLAAQRTEAVYREVLAEAGRSPSPAIDLAAAGGTDADPASAVPHLERR